MMMAAVNLKKARDKQPGNMVKGVPKFISVKVYTLKEKVLLAEYIISHLPDNTDFGRACKYINDPNLMPILKWNVPSPAYSSQITVVSLKQPTLYI